jgi:hypothetical protein
LRDLAQSIVHLQKSVQVIMSFQDLVEIAAFLVSLIQILWTALQVCIGSILGFIMLLGYIIGKFIPHDEDVVVQAPRESRYDEERRRDERRRDERRREERRREEERRYRDKEPEFVVYRRRY